MDTAEPVFQGPARTGGAYLSDKEGQSAAYISERQARCVSRGGLLYFAESGAESHCSSMAEHRFRKADVVGSTPTGGSIFI